MVSSYESYYFEYSVDVLFFYGEGWVVGVVGYAAEVVSLIVEAFEDYAVGGVEDVCLSPFYVVHDLA